MLYIFAMKKIVLVILGTGVLCYLGLYIYFYSIQDDRFKSVTLPHDHTFTYEEEFEELNFRSDHEGHINSLLFKADSSHGVVCFWKGNGGNLAVWGKMAPVFLKHNYDVIITDYRQHGKSTGDITIDNFYSDAQVVYDFLKTKYSEDEIVVAGYSLGTNIASHLSADNKPALTILIDPREKFGDNYLKAFFFPFPNIIRFPFRTDLDLQRITTPVAIITGTQSDLYSSAVRLNKLLKEHDIFFEIEGATHQTILNSNELDTIFNSLLSK